jgi:TatD DNase family protein
MNLDQQHEEPAGPPETWMDTHCHLDAPEFDADRAEVIARSRAAGVGLIVVPAVSASTFASAAQAARQCGGAYALGIHPLFVKEAPEAEALNALAQALEAQIGDTQLVAVGEIGLDHFVAAFQDEASRALQERIYAAQLALAVRHGLPVILHVRRSADLLLKHLRKLRDAGHPVQGGIAHAFNGSDQQAQVFLELGFKLGFGGAMTFERALQIRRLAAELPDDAIVLETDAPDIPPHWLYLTAETRAQGARSRNEPGELPRIAGTLAELRGWSLSETRARTCANALAALPRLRQLNVAQGSSRGD